jgi:NitT/TauT family transport system ATP-binding protein
MLARDPFPVAVFEVDRLTLDYPSPAGTVRAVDDVSFRAGEGERLVLLGPSAAESRLS